MKFHSTNLGLFGNVPTDEEGYAFTTVEEYITAGFSREESEHAVLQVHEASEKLTKWQEKHA